MKEKQLTELSLATLNKNRAKIKGLLIVGGFFWFLFVLMILYILIFKSKSIIPFVPIVIALPLTFLPAINSMSQINKEIKLRNQNQFQ